VALLLPNSFTTNMLKLAHNLSAILLAAALTLTAAGTVQSAAAEPNSAPLAAEKTPASVKPADYMRFVKKGDDLYALELATRSFVKIGKDGKPVTVTLVSAVHIGAEDYYARLQQILDARELLLFEGVGDDAADRPRRRRGGSANGKQHPANVRYCGVHAAERLTKEAKRRRAGGDGKTLYDMLAEGGGLTVQMRGINYERPHFKNADLTMGGMKKILNKEASRGGKEAKEARDALTLMNQMESMLTGGGGFEMLLMRGLTGLMRNSPQARALFLLHLATTTENVEDSAALNGLGGLFEPLGLRRLMRLVLEDRNAAVMRMLRKELAATGAPRDIGVFYGAAHMRGMEEELVSKMGFRPTRTVWLTAFTVSPRAAGLPDALSRNFTHKADAAAR